MISRHCSLSYVARQPLVRTPGTVKSDNVSTVEAADRRLRARWLAWEATPYPTDEYPPGSDAGEVEGVDLALTDGDVGKILHDFFVAGRLDEEARATLPEALGDLARVVPHLKGRGRAYFETALELLSVVDDRNGQR